MEVSDDNTNLQSLVNTMLSLWQSDRAHTVQLQESTVGKYGESYDRKYRPKSHRTENKCKEQNEFREENK